MQAMTFEQFRASGRYVEDLEKAMPGLGVGYEGDGPFPGRIYANGLYIEKNLEGNWHLIIERDEWIRAPGDLRELEEILWSFGLAEDPADDGCGELFLPTDGDLNEFIRGYCKLRHAEVDGDAFGIHFSGAEAFRVSDAIRICDETIKCWNLDRRSAR